MKAIFVYAFEGILHHFESHAEQDFLWRSTISCWEQMRSRGAVRGKLSR
jgi:hypothetical protein